MSMTASVLTAAFTHNRRADLPVKRHLAARLNQQCSHAAIIAPPWLSVSNTAISFPVRGLISSCLLPLICLLVTLVSGGRSTDRIADQCAGP